MFYMILKTYIHSILWSQIQYTGINKSIGTWQAMSKNVVIILWVQTAGRGLMACRGFRYCNINYNINY